jgi:hypothetical protein
MKLGWDSEICFYFFTNTLVVLRPCWDYKEGDLWPPELSELQSSWREEELLPGSVPVLPSSR